jgi:hypothetical protein
VYDEDQGILRTTDGGSTWIQYAIPGVFLNHISFSDLTHGTAVGYQGVALTTTDGGDTSLFSGHGYEARPFWSLRYRCNYSNGSWIERHNPQNGDQPGANADSDRYAAGDSDAEAAPDATLAPDSVITGKTLGAD